MPGDHSPRPIQAHYDCGHISAPQVVRSNLAQRAEDVEYMRQHGYPDYMKPWLCPDCEKKAKVKA